MIDSGEDELVRRAVGTFVVIGLISSAIWIGLNSSKPPEPSFSLVSNTAQEIGVVTVSAGAELCWKLSLEELPKAIQLHHDIPGPSDPVVVSLFEPPAHPKAEGCQQMPPEYERVVTQDHTAFYVDGHDSEDEPWSLWAQLVPGLSAPRDQEGNRTKG